MKQICAHLRPAQRLFLLAPFLGMLLGTTSVAEETDPREREVEQLIQRYFRTWSDQDMEGYAATFMDNACVQFLDAEGRLTTFSLAPFLAGQRDAHRTARHRQIEVPVSTDIRFEAELARAVVYWKLTAGPRTHYGYDHFTLVKSGGQWRIANLLFYVTRRSD
jgi:hypothetical protein